MPNLKEIRIRIASVNSTKQITSAMKMVSAAKLRRAQDAIIQLRPYANKLEGILQSISDNVGSSNDNVFGKERPVNKVLIVVITSNKGLCGAFNSNIIKKTIQLVTNDYAALNQKGKVELMVIGKKAYDYFRTRNFKIVKNYRDPRPGSVPRTNTSTANRRIGCDSIVHTVDRLEGGACQPHC